MTNNLYIGLNDKLLQQYVGGIKQDVKKDTFSGFKL